MANTYTNLQFHLVFSTKHRVNWIYSALQPRLWNYMAGICRDLNMIPMAINGVNDHAHLLVGFRPTHSVAEMTQRIKSASSHWLHETEEGFADFAWQTGYAAFTVSSSQVAAVKKYIQHQQEHHHKQSFADELRALMNKHGIEFDEKYLLD